LEPLTGLDASFLYLEDAHTPMHVGSLLVFEGSMKFTEFRNTLAARVHLVPKLRQRLVMVPLGLGKPYWADDPDFNINMHLQHVGLPRPGSWRELRSLAARIFSRPLDRRRPLWDMVFVEGLDQIPQLPPGSVALISKVHHAAVDGVSGADMMSVLFDVTREPRQVKPPTPRIVEPIPNELTMLGRTMRRTAGKPALVPQLVRELVQTARAGPQVRSRGHDAPPAPFTAPPTPLNRVISPERIWNTALLDLDRVKLVKDVLSCTLNDVVLGICASALRRYLDEKDALPAESLVAMVPVSTRPKEEHGTGGNRLSAMLVELRTDIEDPVDRLRAIKTGVQGGKAHQSAIGARTLADVAEFVPFGLAGRASRLYSRFQMSERHRPLFNCVITNVPGPQMEMYVAGHKLFATMGMAPIIDGMGLIITVFSYNGVLSLSPTSCPSVMPDLDDFSRYLREAANELEERALQLRAAQGAAEQDRHTEQELDLAPLFEQMKERLQSLNEERPLGAGELQLHVTGRQEQDWLLRLDELSVEPGASDTADAKLTIRGDHLHQVFTGKLDPQVAFVQGKLRIEGDVSKAMELGTLLTQIQDRAP
jgi:diacylglycerol O-acyltransferase